MSRYAAKRCELCGEIIERVTSSRQKYHPECRKIVDTGNRQKAKEAYTERQKEAARKARANRPKTVQEIAAAARAAGMTYGKYVSKHGL